MTVFSASALPPVPPSITTSICSKPRANPLPPVMKQFFNSIEIHIYDDDEMTISV